MKLNCVIAGILLTVSSGLASATTLAQAEAAVAEAQAAGYPWTTTLNLLEKAKKAQESNDKANMDKFIAEIMKQTKAAMYQAEVAAKAGPRF